MRLVWRASARDDLNQILTYIAKRDAVAARSLLGAIQACAERLPEHPFMHRSGRVPGTREAVVHPNYLIIYRVRTDSIEIVSIVHARQQYP
ncbi:MAG: type II toxin-antitoxin system RelE/ParE family toxin [Sphingomonadaceae bacterium]